MPKFLWALIIGGLVTFLIFKTKNAYTWLAAAATVALTFYLWKKG